MNNQSAQNGKLAKNVLTFFAKKSFFDFNFFSTHLQLDEENKIFVERKVLFEKKLLRSNFCMSDVKNT